MKIQGIILTSFIIFFTFIGTLLVNGVIHEEGHVAACTDLKGTPSVAYSLGGLAGKTTCEGLTPENLKIANALAATHEVYTYQIGVILMANALSTLTIILFVYMEKEG